MSLLIALVLLASPPSLPPAPPSSAPSDLPSLSDDMAIARSNNDFAFALFRQVAAPDGNVFLSPLSISTALAMTSAGAREQTEAEMRSVLRFSIPQDRVHGAFTDLMAGLASADQKDCTIRVANRLWGQQRMQFLEPFLAITRDRYHAELARLDFGSPEPARATINAWVEKETESRIRDLLPPGTITPDTSLVLTNAIYFKGTWTSQFKASETKPADFFLSSGKTTKADLMQQSGRLSYFEDEELQALELSYRGDRLAMLVLLPKDASKLPALEASMSAEKLDRIVGSMGRRPTRVFLPRMKLESSFSLASALSAMGMTSAFGPGADFSGMTGNRDLFISAVLHKAFAEVNEEGSEAAAATAVVMTRSLARPPSDPVTFRADHPFLFAIRDVRSGAVLFLGRFAGK